MNIPALNSAADPVTPVGATHATTLAERLAVLYHSLVASRSSRCDPVEGSLADLNDETLLDLGFDPATFRNAPALTDPIARLYY